MDWLRLAEVAAECGVKDRALQLHIQRKGRHGKVIWHGTTFNYREVPGVGGKSGLSYQIAAESLPVGLQLALKDSQGAFERPLRLDQEASQWRNWWVHHLAAISALPPRSRARGAAIAEFAGRTHLGPDNQVHTFSGKTIRRRLEELASGLAALTQKKRADAGRRKVIVTREFDNAARAVGVDDAPLHLIEEKLKRYMRSLIAADATFSKIKFLAEGKLNELASSAGIATDGNRFKVPDHRIRMHRQFKAVARLRRDAKAHKDASPHISRSIAGLWPNDIIIGDIHPIDIVMTRPDGTTATARLIGWMDVATHRVFASIVLCDAGTGIRNAHVIQSFMDMVQAWGLPKSLYLDNGAEYNFADLLDGVLKLANSGVAIDAHRRFRGDGSRLTRSLPYNAQAKGLIEGGFRILETLFRDVQGYIGGNRLLKKSANVGRPPMPFGGPLDELQAVLSLNLRLYNGSPQRGQLQGLPPDQAFADLVEAGWTMTAIDQQTLMLAFTREEHRPVRNGLIHYDGHKWTCPELQAYHGKTVAALIPQYQRWDGIPLRDEQGQLMGIAREDKAYEYHDTAGAEESARRKKRFKDGVKSLEAQTDRIDVQAELARNVVRLPTPVRAPVGAAIGGTAMAQEIIAGLQETADEAKIRKAREADKRADEHYARMVANLERQKRDMK